MASSTLMALCSCILLNHFRVGVPFFCVDGCSWGDDVGDDLLGLVLFMCSESFSFVLITTSISGPPRKRERYGLQGQEVVGVLLKAI